MDSDPILVPFRAEHLLMFVNRDGREFVAPALDIEKRSIAWTAVKDGRVIGCAGVTLVWQGVGMAWACLSPDAASCMFWATKMVRRILRDIIRAHKLHRVEMVALFDSERNRHWARFLGFQEENGVAHSYTSDRRDMVRYEWVKKDG